MALDFGWRPNDVRESIWSGDPALGEVPATAMEGWRTDGDASHLEPFVKHGQPTRIQFRNLNADETRVVQAYFVDAPSPIEAYARACLMAFRIAVSFVDKESIQTPDGERHSVVTKERGIRMLAQPFVEHLERAHPGIVGFYGGLIFNASIATEKEKKASSPPSTQTLSSEAASTVATTEASPPAGAA